MIQSGRPIIHIVSGATLFCAVSFLRNHTSTESCNHIQKLRSLVYLERLKVLWTNRDLRIHRRRWKRKSWLLEFALENPKSWRPTQLVQLKDIIPLRLVNKRIRAEIGCQTVDKERLKLAVFVVRCTAGPESLCSTFLVFGATRLLAQNCTEPVKLKRSKLIKKFLDKLATKQS